LVLSTKYLGRLYNYFRARAEALTDRIEECATRLDLLLQALPEQKEH
jgi:hypothetical protein